MTAVGTLQWMPGTIYAPSSEGGVIVQTSHGSTRLRGRGLEKMVGWAQSEFDSPKHRSEVLRSFPEERHQAVSRLLDVLLEAGALRGTEGEDDVPSQSTFKVSSSRDHDAEKFGTEIEQVISRDGYHVEPQSRLPPVPFPTITIVCESVSCHPGDSIRAVILRGDSIWLLTVPDSIAVDLVLAEFYGYLLQSSVREAMPRLSRLMAWAPWIARKAQSYPTSDRVECIELGVGKYEISRHNYVSLAMGGAIDLAEVALSSTLQRSEALSMVVDSVTSPINSPSEVDLQQMPLQLSKCSYRTARGENVTLGTGWTLEEARVQAVERAIQAHSIDSLETSITAELVLGPEPKAQRARNRIITADFANAHLDESRVVSRSFDSSGTLPEPVLRWLIERDLAHRLNLPCEQISIPGELKGSLHLRTFVKSPRATRVTGYPIPVCLVSVDAETWVAGMGATEALALQNAVYEALLFYQSQEIQNLDFSPKTFAMATVSLSGENMTACTVTIPGLVPDGVELWRARLPCPLVNGRDETFSHAYFLEQLGQS